MVQVEDGSLRAEQIEKIVKGFALQNYIFKTLVMETKSNSWKETYFQENSTELKAAGNRKIKGIPRMAKFPTANVNWTKKSAYIEKYGLETTISYEDYITNEIDVIARSLLRIARGVAASVDSEIYSTLSENGTPVNINSIVIPAGFEWNSATIANRNPISDILDAIAKITIKNYDPYSNKSFLCLSPTDYASILKNSQVQAQLITEKIVKNGKIAQLVGLDILVSNNVPNDQALIVVSKIAGTWKKVQDLNVTSIEDKGIKWTIRAFEVGVTQLTNPGAITIITNTQA